MNVATTPTAHRDGTRRGGTRRHVWRAIALLAVAVGLVCAVPQTALALTGLDPSMTVIGTRANPISLGEGVTLSATVMSVPPGGPTPTGSATFWDEHLMLGTFPLDATGNAYCVANFGSAGDHLVTASYGGDEDYLGSESPELKQTVNVANTTTSLTSNRNPASRGLPVEFTATVSNSMAGGDVTFFDGTTELRTVSPSLGIATLVTGFGSVGDHQITAVYKGDANTKTSTSPELTQVVIPVSPVMRLYNPMTGFHIWSADPTEIATILSGADGTWTEEGIAFRIDPTIPANHTPVIRFRNRRSGYYLYTADPDEIANITRYSLDVWAREGEAFRASRTSLPDVKTIEMGMRTVWRFINLKDGSYFYTSNEDEKANIESNLGSLWKLEGVAFWFALPTV